MLYQQTFVASTAKLHPRNPGCTPRSYADGRDHGAVAPLVQPKLQLYDDDHSLFCSKIRVALFAKGLQFESLSVPCGSTKSPEFLAVAPLGKIPALLVHDQDPPLVLMESEVINEYLEERFPHVAPLMPAHPTLRAHVRLISRFHDIYLEAALRRLYPQVDPSVRDPAVVASAVDEFASRLTQLEQLLTRAQADAQHIAEASTSSTASTAAATGVSSDEGDSGRRGAGANNGPSTSRSDATTVHRTGPPGQGRYAVGTRLTLADCGYPALFLYAGIILPALGHGGLMDAGAFGTRWPHVAAWRATLGRDPHVAAAMDELRPAALAWLNKKLGHSGVSGGGAGMQASKL